LAAASCNHRAAANCEALPTGRRAVMCHNSLGTNCTRRCAAERSATRLLRPGSTAQAPPSAT